MAEIDSLNSKKLIHTSFPLLISPSKMKACIRQTKKKEINTLACNSTAKF